MRWLVLVVLLGVVGCDCSGGGSPCTTCPPLAGTWVMAYDTGSSNGCDQAHLDTLPTMIFISQQQSVLHGTIDGASMTGSLFDTFDFTMNGSLDNIDGGSLVVSIKALYVPSQMTGTTTDDKIETGTFSRSTLECQEDTPFTAHR